MTACGAFVHSLHHINDAVLRTYYKPIGVDILTPDAIAEYADMCPVILFTDKGRLSDIDRGLRAAGAFRVHQQGRCSGCGVSARSGVN